jgi:deoxyribodipyrimidine photo-lyase
VSKPVYLVWLKRNLRLQDNAALLAALELARAAKRPLQLLYIQEPSLEADVHYGPRDWRFVAESLDALDQALQQEGVEHRVLRLSGECVDVLEELLRRRPIAGLFSEEEIGIRRTWDRDKAVAAWARQRGISWREEAHQGVQRGRSDRQGWRARWYAMVRKPIPAWHGLPETDAAARVATQSPEERAQALPFLMPAETTAWTEGMPNWAFEDRRYGGQGAAPASSPASTAAFSSASDIIEPVATVQPGGCLEAHRVLERFLTERLPTYIPHISKPAESRNSCSRLSPHLAWGNLSLRQAWQAAEAHKTQGGQRRAISAFQSRLRWRDHFMQKFESEPRMEWVSVNAGYHDFDKALKPEWVKAWTTGHTGIPMVDACMRCLNATGYLNFRMRAMLVSFLCHHLWQPWQAGAPHLGRQFLDFEPGIHYPQFIMQAGETGTNTIRIYNPVKQGTEHDPKGAFVRQWVPELRPCPEPFIHEPWRLSLLEQSAYGFRLGEHYPLPLVDLAESGRHARTKLWSKRNDPAVRKDAQRILKRHIVPGKRWQ